MLGEANLNGHRILVLEDDYYLANDTARALERAGAEVIGPCANEQVARDKMERATPTGAVIDINLGHGASFEMAKMLRDRAIPILFVTGYDENTIPPEYSDVPMLQKPADLRQIVAAVVKTLDDV